MPEIQSGGSYADELAQYQRLQQKFTSGDRGAADAADLAAYKKLQEKMAGGGITPDTKAGKIEPTGNTSRIGLEAPVEPPKPAEAPAAPPKAKKKKKGCLSRIGDAIKKVAGFIGKAVPVVAQLMDAFKAFSLATGDTKKDARKDVIAAAKDVGKAAAAGDAQSQLLVDAFKATQKPDTATSGQGTLPPNVV